MSAISRRPSLHRRVITSRLADNFEENDDEAERLARRERINSSVVESPSRSGLDSSFHMNATELNQEINECIKLNTENKITNKNAFQLKLIDYLVYALRKHDPNMSNLQVASASLDASAKIYGCRVDKVHTEILKILGVSNRNDGEAEPGNEVLESENEHQVPLMKKKKRKRKSEQQLIVSSDRLRCIAETYDPRTAINISQRDTQTSDMLFQANSTQHANQRSLLNHYKDVVLDGVSSARNEFTFYVPTVDDFEHLVICSSYSAFKFNHWTAEDDEGDNYDYHFDLNADVSVLDDQEEMRDSDNLMECDDVFEERCNRLEQSCNNVNIVDFQDIITNSTNLDQSSEYSYFQKNYSIKWAGPSHWRIRFNRNLTTSTTVVDSCKQTNKRRKKVLDLAIDEDTKKLAENKFIQKKKKQQVNNKLWSEEKLLIPEEVDNSYKHYYTFFIKPERFEPPSNRRQKNPQIHTDANDDDCNGSNSIDFGNCDDDPPNNDYGSNDENSGFFPDDNAASAQTCMPFQTQEAFTADNLVSAPRMAEKVFIPYSQRAKKIDMHHLKKVVWKNLTKSSEEYQEEENNENHRMRPKMFSDVYLEIPLELNKIYAESLSPGIAFVSILHLSHEKNLKVEQQLDLSDLDIRCNTSFSD